MLRVREFGVAARLIDAREAMRMMPMLHAEHAAAIAHYPGDVYLDPTFFTRGIAESARCLGCALMPDTTVEEVVVSHGRVDGVRTSRGVVAAPIVVNSAGARARDHARFASLPMIAVWHQLLVTRPLEGVDPRQPITRILDSNVYVCPCDVGLILGGYERDLMLLDNTPTDVSAMPLDLAVLKVLAASVSAESLIFADLEGATQRGGMPTMTLDDHHLIGPVPGVEGLFVLGGCNVGGLSTSLAFAEALCRIIADPTAAETLAPLLPARFAGCDVAEPASREACRLHYGRHYWSTAARERLV